MNKPSVFPKYGRFSLQELADAVDEARKALTGEPR